MKLVLGLDQQSQGGGGVSGPVITINGTTGGVAIIGDHASITMSASEGTISARKWGSTPGGSEYGTGTSPTDYTAGDGGTLYATATVDGSDYSRSAPITYAAPVAAGGLADRNYATGSGNQTVDASTDFTGSDISYSVSTAISGVTIDAGTGVVTIPTASDATGTITVTGTNSGGSDQSAFSVTIAAASGSITFGEYTLVGAGAAPISEADGTYGEFTVSGGQITGNTTPLTTGDVTVGSTTVSVVADTYSVLPDQTEVEAAAADAPLASTRTAVVRDGTTSTAAYVTIAKAFTGRFTIQSENYRAAVFSGGFSLVNSNNITLHQLEITRLSTVDDEEMVVDCLDTIGITVTDCELYSKDMETIDFVSKAGYYDVTNASLRLVGSMGGSGNTADNLTVTDCDMHDCFAGIRLVASDGANISRNNITRFTANPTELQGDNWTWNDNRVGDCWSHGGGNTGATGPNNPYAGAKWRIPVASAASFVVGETVTGATSTDSYEIFGIETATHEGKDWLFVGGYTWTPNSESSFYSDGETLTGDIAGSTTMDGEAHAVFPFDYGDPHNSLFGTGSGGDNLTMVGNIGVIGTGRLDANMPDVGLLTQDYTAIASGPKFNDPLGGTYTNVTCHANFFAVSDQSGLVFGDMQDSSIKYNAVVYDSGTGTNNSPNMYFASIGTNVEVVGNYATTVTGITNGDQTDLNADLWELGYNNLLARYVGQDIEGIVSNSGDPNTYPALFDGPAFDNLTVANAETKFSAKAGGPLLTGPTVVGPFGTGVYNFSTNTASIPSHTKPASVTAIGVDLNKVVFDGSQSFRISESAPFLGITNTDEMTIIIGGTLDAAGDGVDMYLISGVSGSIGIRRKPNGRLFLFVEDSSGNNALYASPFKTWTSADGYSIWTFTWKLSTGELVIMHNNVIQPFSNVYQVNGNGITTSALYSDFMVGVRMDLEFLIIDDQKLDLYDQATLNKIVSLDGKHPAYGADASTVMGAQPLIYLTGNAAAWNADTLQLGSISAPAVMTGTVTDVSGGDVVAPTISSTSPADNATGVTADSVIDIVFDETVTLQTGNIVLRDNDGGWADLETFNVATGTGDGGGTVVLTTTSVSNDTVRITPGSDMVGDIEHAVRIDATAVDDVAGNSFAGIADDTTLSFTIESATFSAVWADFSGTGYLSRTGGIGGSTGVTQMLQAFTFRAPDFTSGNYIMGNSGSIDVPWQNSTGVGFILVDVKNESNVRTFYAGSNALSVDTDYLALASYNGTTGVGKMAVIDIATGTTYTPTPVTQLSGATMDFSLSNWVIGAQSLAGAFKFLGRLERVQQWLGVSPDVTTSGVQDLFYDSGTNALLSPSVAIGTYGTPPVSLVGAGLTTGTNGGSGGDFTVTGTITTV